MQLFETVFASEQFEAYFILFNLWRYFKKMPHFIQSILDKVRQTNIPIVSLHFTTFYTLFFIVCNLVCIKAVDDYVYVS